MRELIVALALVVAACAGTPPGGHPLTATGGDRQAGYIELSLQTTPMGTPRPNLEQGKELAAEKCRSWGYKGAEAFGGRNASCLRSNGGHCVRYQHTYRFQCLN